MPGQALEIKADFDNVESMTVCSDVMWRFDIESPDGEIREGITVCAADIIELKSGREVANYVMKWEKGGDQAYIKIVDVKKVRKGATTTYNTPSSFSPVAAFECRGLKIKKYHPGADFDVKSSSGQTFPAEGVDFAEDTDWYDVDDNNEPVSVTEIEGKLTSF
jgi:hypothetical protein